jgi:hypothetical protein
VSDYHFTPDELVALQAHQDFHMMDRCTIDRYTMGVANQYGLAHESYVSDLPIYCGWWEISPSEELSISEVNQIKCKVRLPVDTVISGHDRITVVERHGVMVVPVQYEIVGNVHRGSSGLVADLQRVTDL